MRSQFIYTNACKGRNIKLNGFNILAPTLFLLLSIFLLGCENLSQPSSSEVVNAHWDATTQTLHMSGQTEPGGDSVQIHDASSGEVLGAALVKSDGSWSATTNVAACEIHVDLPDGTASTTVVDAPRNCTGSSINSRAATVNDVPVGVLVTSNPEILSTIPNAVILNPPTDMTINVGETLAFTGMAIGTVPNQPVGYNWNFGGSAPNSTVQNPGTVKFSRAGIFYISLSVSSVDGIPDPTPAVRTIIVNDNLQPSANSPQPIILTPSSATGSVNINVGESLLFSGIAIDSSGSTGFTYEWNFSGAVPNQFGPTPGNILFSRAGNYLVTLNATNAIGVRSTVPATIQVNVAGSTAFNQAPSGTIVSPARDVVVSVGQSLQFTASGRDPDNNNPLYYSWDFDGLSPNIYMSTSTDGGTVVFNNPGVFNIEMTVTDSLGAIDPRPSDRRITVTGNPPTNGTLNNIIVSPPVDVVIAPGESVFFSGQAAPINGVGPFQYFWDFDGAVANSSLQTPGDISFPIPGEYIVQFYVIDSVGIVVGQPETRIVTVVDPSTIDATILSPQNSSSFEVGTPISLIAKIDNANSFINVKYSWRIRKVGGSTVFQSALLSPGSFTFTEAGEYRIKFTAEGLDAFGNRTIESEARSRVTITDPLTTNNAAIAFPAQDMFVTAGQLVTFQPFAVIGNNIRYEWHFGGATTPSSLATPAPVQFNLPGTYVVTLRITGTDLTGTPVNLYGERLITVINAPAPNPFPIPAPVPNPVPPITGTATPEGFISSPTGDSISIRVGTPLLFTATGFDPIGSGPLTFIWNFGGAVPNIISQNPGTVTFNRVGEYVVSLLVKNSLGQYDTTPDTMVVIVTP